MSRAAEVWGSGPVSVRREMYVCLQPAGDRRLDAREEGEAGQKPAVWKFSGKTGPCKQHHTPSTGRQGLVHLPLSGQSVLQFIELLLFYKHVSKSLYF